ncbi:MAG: DMT family transporter [Saprospiraceae bacterium]|nr:DMT family transporter [Saprospiraceae bacterium]
MNSNAKSYLYLHLAVFLFGFTGILGQVISVSAGVLILYRCLLSSLIMIPLLIYFKSLSGFDKKSYLQFSGIGIILGLHWLCFYGSIKLSNASVAMICLSTISVMTVFFEALFNKRKINRQDLLIGFLVIPGILLIHQSLKSDFKLGFWVGILCSVFSAIVASLNKKYINSGNSIAISWIEITIVALLFSVSIPVLSAFGYLEFIQPSQSDWIYLLILSLFCTVIPLTLSVKSMRQLSAFSAMLVFNLETVYGIILSMVILKEYKDLNWMFYLGVIIILTSVFAHPFLRKVQDK